ncbi:MAG: hypothetical protein HY812_18860 [Planctomycetes bacterium]|nr:hypothetical protein [Planctomycetota bacterium]
MLKRVRVIHGQVNGVEISRIAGIGAKQRDMLRAPQVNEPSPLVAVRRCQGRQARRVAPGAERGNQYLRRIGQVPSQQQLAAAAQRMSA